MITLNILRFSTYKYLMKFKFEDYKRICNIYNLLKKILAYFLKHNKFFKIGFNFFYMLSNK